MAIKAVALKLTKRMHQFEAAENITQTRTGAVEFWKSVLHLRGVGPWTTDPEICKLDTEKCEAPKSPEVPQSCTGTQPVHSEE
jgi:hypothetical protein